MPPKSVGLVYLDPPFATERAFDAGLRRERSALGMPAPLAFDDRWESYRAQASLPKNLEEVVRVSGIVAGRRLGLYVRFMAERLHPLARVLSDRGALYLHVSPDVAPYLRLLLDAVFGARAFRNEIAWKRTHAHSGTRRYGPVHDTILFYARDGFAWHRPKGKVDADYVNKHFRERDSKGRTFQLVTCTGPGDRTGTKAHYLWRGKLPPPGRHWAWKRDRMEELEAAGMIRYSAKGIPRRVYYADEYGGTPLQDIWTDISRLDSHSAERIGFETQKPLALLSRIVEASAPLDGELVFDGFAGTGTTLLAAERAGCSWIGVDGSLKSTALALGRLGADGVPERAIRLVGLPSTTQELARLAAEDNDTFGVWATGVLGMPPDSELSSPGAIFARCDSASGKIIRAVAGARLAAAHLRTLSASDAASRFAISLEKTTWRGKAGAMIDVTRLVDAVRTHGPVSPSQVAAR